jgi:hypothetical protein
MSESLGPVRNMAIDWRCGGSEVSSRRRIFGSVHLTHCFNLNIPFGFILPISSAIIYNV